MFRYGRINRPTYWLSVAMLASVYAAIYFATGKPVHIAEAVLFLLAVPRLHDIGRSGWWAGGFLLAEFVVAFGAVATLPMNMAMIVVGGFVIVVGVLLIVLGSLPGSPEGNKYGDPPPTGISFRRPTPPADHFN